jgi:hypothetical protein
MVEKSGALLYEILIRTVVLAKGIANLRGNDLDFFHPVKGVCVAQGSIDHMVGGDIHLDFLKPQVI